MYASVESDLNMYDIVDEQNSKMQSSVHMHGSLSIFI